MVLVVADSSPEGGGGGQSLQLGTRPRAPSSMPPMLASPTVSRLSLFSS